MTSLQLDQETLRPLIHEVVQQTLAQSRTREPGEERIAFTEREAAELIGMKVWQLRDKRLEGKVTATQIGRRWYYTREQLLSLFEND